MPVRPCPKCARPAARWLEASSSAAWVNYYRCDACGHVWSVPKDTPVTPATPATPSDDPQS